jgi:serine/threonine protein kinase
MFHAGQLIGLYKLSRKLGKGGFGEVWLAEKHSEVFTKFTKKVAVKLPHEEQVDFDAIEQEATLWEQASGHSNVLPIIDVHIYDGQVVIVSEYADGGSLADKLKAEGKLPIKQAVEMSIGILNGLEYLHNKKIIHRDIKPENILLQGDTPRLTDFGISRAMNTSTLSSIVVGTDAYMSPEAFDGKRNVQTDIWSVGVVLYQVLKGDLPFPQPHPSERMYAILTKEFEPFLDDIPAELKEIVQKALAKKPIERYQTVGEMREDLRKFLANLNHSTFAPTEFFHKSAVPVVNALASPTAASKTILDRKQPVIEPNYYTPPKNNDGVRIMPELSPTVRIQTPETHPQKNRRSPALVAIVLILLVGGAGVLLASYSAFFSSSPAVNSNNTWTNYNSTADSNSYSANANVMDSNMAVSSNMPGNSTSSNVKGSTDYSGSNRMSTANSYKPNSRTDNSNYYYYENRPRFNTGYNTRRNDTYDNRPYNRPPQNVNRPYNRSYGNNARKP